MSLLDIGCGWGGLARHAAEHYGCRVVGITISEEQRRYGAEASRGLPVEIRLQDYREISEKFDRVVSVGMLEHVGPKNYREYMRKVFETLRPGGVFLCQSIAANSSSLYPDPWVARYIFPNSMIPSAAQVSKATEKLLVLEDVQNLGGDYEKTLKAWESNFRRSWHRFASRYGETFYRMWRFYLLAARARSAREACNSFSSSSLRAASDIFRRASDGYSRESPLTCARSSRPEFPRKRRGLGRRRYARR